jgi:hypothetical protein
MPQYGNNHLSSLRAALLDNPIYTRVASLADLRRFEIIISQRQPFGHWVV